MGGGGGVCQRTLRGVTSEECHTQWEAWLTTSSTKTYTSDSHSQPHHSLHAVSQRHRDEDCQTDTNTITEQLIMGRGQGQTHTKDGRAVFGVCVSELCNTHCRSEAHPSCQHSQLLHHSTSVPGCSGRWSSGTHSGCMWM